MKKKLLLLFLAIHASILCAWGYEHDVTIDGITYTCTYSNPENYAVVKSCSSTVTGHVTIRSSISYENTTYNVTVIRGSAFRNCSGVTSITIPNSVTSIGYEAFEGCTGLQTVSISNTSKLTSIGHEAFRGCSNLTSINIPDGVTIIDSSAFYDCTNLQTASISNSSKLETIGSYAFKGCSSLTSINIPDGVTSIGNYAFSECTELQTASISNSSKLETIGRNTFYSCSSLTSINIPDEATSIGYEAFKGCIGLQTASISNSSKLTGIGGSAFYNCSSLTSINIPDGVTSIGESAFSGCTNLQTASISKSSKLTSIGYNAFSGCSSLESFLIPANVENVGRYGNGDAFSGCSNISKLSFYCKNVGKWFSSSKEKVEEILIGKSVEIINSGAFYSFASLTKLTFEEGSSLKEIGGSAFYGCSSLPSINIPDGVTSIGSSAFYKCSSLTSINIPDGVTSIGGDTFRLCANLQTASISNSSKLETIGSYAFKGCSSLTSINIPDGVTSIGSYAFENCTDLQTASISEKSKLESIGTSAFYSCSSLTSINIPDGVTSIELYTFNGCTNLQTASISNSSKLESIGYGAFSGCSSLTSIIIPDGVTSIGKYTFYGCTDLQTASISNSSKLETFGSNAFNNCSSLTSINIPDGVTSIDADAFENCTDLQTASISKSSKLTSIGHNAFRNCSSLESFLFPANLETVGSYVFEGCSNISKLSFYCKNIGNWFLYSYSAKKAEEILIGKSVEIINVSAFNSFASLTKLTIEEGSSLKEIGGSAFYGCSSLPSIIIPDGVTNIGSEAFRYCTSLQTASISKNSKLESIGYNAFSGCSSLESFLIPANVETVGNNAFSGCSNITKLSFYCKNVGNWFSSSKEILIGKSVEIINSGAFYSFASLTNLKFEDDSSLKEIESYAFRDCDALKEVDLPEPLETLGNRAFYSCGKLETIKLPKTLKAIQDNAFNDCSALKDVYAYMLDPFEINVDVFSTKTYKNATLHVNGVADKYRETYAWSKFFHIINPGETPGEGDGGDDSENPVPGHHEKKVTITANSYTINYGDDLPEYGYTTTGAALNGTPEISCEATKTSPVGTYPIVISKGTVTNTKTTFVNGTLTITKAPLTIKAGSYTKVEGEENPTFTLTYEGFKNNETSAVLTKQPTVSCSATKDSPAGEYPVTVSGAEAQNYEISYVAGTLIVTEKNGDINPDGIITFADAKVKAICVAKWDTDGDGELSKEEAEAVTSIGSVFRGKDITSFDELRFFTGLTTIPQSAFSGCTSLKSIKLPNTITTIENYAFCYCHALMSLTIPASVTSIGAYEFEYCHSLSELIVEEGNTVYDSRDHCNAIIQTEYNMLKYGCKNTVIPESVTQTGGSDVFYGNEGLTSIHIPAKVSNINSGLFTGCKNLATITVAAGNKKYDSRNNCNAIIETSSNELIEGCKNTVIPDDVVSIRYEAFSGRAFGKMTIPGNVKKIGNFAFYESSELKTVVMEEGVEEIGENAFGYCTLETIVLPSTVTTIKSYAFRNNPVRFVKSSITTPFEIPNDAFDCYSTATLYVPAGTRSLYEQTTGWKGFENIVEMGAVKPGDANGDGYVNMTDVNAVKDYILTGKTEGFNFFNADVNGDKVVNAADIVRIINIIKSYNSAEAADDDPCFDCPDVEPDPTYTLDDF